MGISIGHKYFMLDGGYSMMFILRREIAFKLDAELGGHYANMMLANSPFEQQEYWDEMQKILNSDRFNEDNKDILDFLFASDCGGKINYKTCKKIYELVQDVENYPVGYAGTGQTFNDFKEILKDCYSKKMNLVWY